MKKVLILLLAAVVTTVSALAADITPEDARNHIGEIVTVKGIVTQVYVSKAANVFLNFGGKYPNQVFSANV